MKTLPSQPLSTFRSTLPSGHVVENQPILVQSPFSFSTKDAIGGKVDGLLAAIDEAAEDGLRTIMPRFFEYVGQLAHPSFDLKLPRRAVLVTTGRLVGGAALAAQDYREYLIRQKEVALEVWDRETLVEIIAGHPESAMAGSIDGPLLALLGEIEQGKCDDHKIETISRSWVGSMEASVKSAVIASILAGLLRRHERLDLACYTALCLIRSAWGSTHGLVKPDPSSLFIANTGRELFRFYSTELLARLSRLGVAPADIIWAHAAPSAHITYPTICLKLVEIIGLLGLINIAEGKRDEAIENVLVEFFRNNPGAKHPISDRWAVSIIPPILLLAASAHDEDVNDWLRGVIGWVGDHYEKDGLGLANPYSKPDDEVRFLLGGAFEHIEPTRNPTSYVAAVVLDLTALLKLKNAYELAINDFLAVEALPCILETEDTKGQYMLEAEGGSLEPNMQYMEKWEPYDGWKVAPHHLRAPDAYYLNRIGRPWDHLAISAVLRDRHFLASCRAFITAATTPNSET